MFLRYTWLPAGNHVLRGTAYGRVRGAVPQQVLHFIEGMPGIDQDAGKGMAQTMDTDIPKVQLMPHPVPEEINIREGARVRAAGEEP